MNLKLIKKNKKILSIVFLIIIVLMFAGVYIYISSSSNNVINETNSEMNEIESYELQKSVEIYENSDLISEQQIDAKINLYENNFILNKSQSESQEINTYQKYGNESYVFKSESDNWFVSASGEESMKEPLGFYNSFYMNPDLYTTNSNILSNGYTANAQISSYEDDVAIDLSDWNIFKKQFPTQNNYDDIDVTVEINDNMRINKIKLNWEHNNLHGNIIYEFKSYNENININEPTNISEAIDEYDEINQESNINANINIDKNNDEIILNVIDYSEDVKNISVRSYQNGETTFNPDENIQIYNNTHYDGSGDSISIGVTGYNGEYVELESMFTGLD